MQVLWLECAPQLCLALCIQSQSHRGGGLSFPHPQAEFNPLTSATSVLLESQDSCNKTGGEAYLYTLSHLKTTPKVSRRSLSKSQCYLPGLSLHATPAPGPHLQGPATTPTRPPCRKQNLSNQPSSAQLWTWGAESPQILPDSGFTAGLLHLSEWLSFWNLRVKSSNLHCEPQTQCNSPLRPVGSSLIPQAQFPELPQVCL